MPRVTGDWHLPAERAGDFEGVNSETLAEAPPACPREGCGGLWRRVDEGYVCGVCGRRWRAAECLRELVGRALFQADRWPTARVNSNGPRPGR